MKRRWTTSYNFLGTGSFSNYEFEYCVILEYNSYNFDSNVMKYQITDSFRGHRDIQNIFYISIYVSKILFLF